MGVARTTKFLENYDNKVMGQRELLDGTMEDYPVFDLSVLKDCKKENNYGYVVPVPPEGEEKEQGRRGRRELPCTSRSCEDHPQGGPRGSAHPHRVQGLLQGGEARHQDQGGDGHV